MEQIDRSGVIRLSDLNKTEPGLNRGQTDKTELYSPHMSAVSATMSLPSDGLPEEVMDKPPTPIQSAESMFGSYEITHQEREDQKLLHAAYLEKLRIYENKKNSTKNTNV